MNFRLAILLSLLIIASSASASENYSTTYKSCIDKSEGVTSNLLECNQEELKKQDLRLNKSYRQALSTLSVEQQTNLRNIQRLWLKYKNAHCGMLATLTGGTIDQLLRSGCELDMTQERADTLDWLSKAGG